MSRRTPSAFYNVFQVFTPTTQAKLNFVPRLKIDERVAQALRTPGKQVIVYGETGSGKSTLLLKKLEELYPAHITTRCTVASTFESILLDAFDQLDQFYTGTVETTAGRSSSLGVEFSRIQASLSRTSSQAEGQSRIIPPQLTPQRLGEFLGNKDLCWVIEDFHKPPVKEKTPLNQTLKIFSDLAAEYPTVKIVAIGATETARQVVEYEPEMANRIAEVLVPLMDDDELGQILENGESLMNVQFNGLKDTFVHYAMGVASVCHQLGLNACLEKGIEIRPADPVVLDEEDLKPIVERYANDSSDTLRAEFDSALFRHRTRRYDNCRLILTALASGPVEGMNNYELLIQIRKVETDYPQGNLTTYLRELLGGKRGNILRHGSDGKYRFIDPLHHTYAQITLTQPPSRRWEGRDQVYFLSAQYLANSFVVQPKFSWSTTASDFRFELPRYVDPELANSWATYPFTFPTVWTNVTPEDVTSEDPQPEDPSEDSPPESP